MSLVSSALKSWLVENEFAVSSLTGEDAWKSAAQKALDAGTLTAEKLSELIGKQVKAADVFGGARVKAASKRYNHTKSVAKHSRSGMPVCNERGREVETVSQRELAKAGAFLKKVAQRSGLPCELNEHESELLAECFDGDWCGKIGGNYETEIPGSRVKVLLNDNTSGGQELVPAFFDDVVIQYPLLHSEILPKVDLVSVPRGNTIDGAAVGNPSVTWAASEATAMTAFTTTSLVSAVDTTIRPVTCAIEIGRDFMADAAVDVGRILTENVGQSLLKELDRVIVLGNGSTEPVGIIGTSGLTDIGVPAGGNGACPTSGRLRSINVCRRQAVSQSVDAVCIHRQRCHLSPSPWHPSGCQRQPPCVRYGSSIVSVARLSIRRQQQHYQSYAAIRGAGQIPLLQTPSAVRHVHHRR